MVAKISPRHRAAFIEALAETGNISLAAAQVKVSRQWSTLLRRRDPAFDAACREAIERARKTLIEPPLPPPLRGSSLTREERGAGFVVHRGNGVLVQVRRARPMQWTEAIERRFLAALAGSCNVKLSAADVGMSKASAYYRRRHHPGFAAAWREAIHTGYVVLEAALVESAINFFNEGGQAPDNPIRGMTATDAMQLLRMHRQEVRGIGGRPGPQRPRVVTPEEAEKEFKKARRRVESWMKREEARKGNGA